MKKSATHHALGFGGVYLHTLVFRLARPIDLLKIQLLFG